MNNDGYVDLFVSKGNVEAQPDFASKDPSNLLLGSADGTFSEAGVRAGRPGGRVVGASLTGPVPAAAKRRRRVADALAADRPAAAARVRPPARFRRPGRS